GSSERSVDTVLSVELPLTTTNTPTDTHTRTHTHTHTYTHTRTHTQKHTDARIHTHRHTRTHTHTHTHACIHTHSDIPKLFLHCSSCDHPCFTSINTFFFNSVCPLRSKMFS